MLSSPIVLLHVRKFALLHSRTANSSTARASIEATINTISLRIALWCNDHQLQESHLCSVFNHVQEREWRAVHRDNYLEEQAGRVRELLSLTKQQLASRSIEPVYRSNHPACTSLCSHTTRQEACQNEEERGLGFLGFDCVCHGRRTISTQIALRHN